MTLTQITKEVSGVTDKNTTTNWVHHNKGGDNIKVIDEKPDNVGDFCRFILMIGDEISEP